MTDEINETTENTEVATLTAEQILKTRQTFSDYVETHHDEISEEIAKDYPEAAFHTAFAQLTQNFEGFKKFAELSPVNQYVFWYITNEQQEVMQAIEVLNQMGCGIFVIKGVLNEDKVEFIPVLKPEIRQKQKQTASRTINKNTDTKNLQMEYWQVYEKICDTLGLGDFQVKPAQQHYQYLAAGKGGCSLLLTFNVKDSLATVEFVNVTDLDKSKFNQLFAAKDKIEEELGELEWFEIPGKKSSKIKTVIKINDRNDRKEWETVIEQQIETAKQFKAVIPKYL